MSKKICQHCESSGQDYLLNPCVHCAGTGFELLVDTRPAIDPIALAKSVMGVFWCRCDLVNGDNKDCSFHKYLEVETT